MTAYRIVTDHDELDNVGKLSHAAIDSYLTGSSFLVASGSSATAASRILAAGTGVSLVDTGPGGSLIISVSSSGGGGTTLPTPSQSGLIFTSTGSDPGDWYWGPYGGFAISSFTGFSRTVEVGTTVSNPTVSMTYNVPPTAASITWTNPTGGSGALSTPFTSYAMSASFESNTIGATSVATLSATNVTTTTRTQTITWAASIVYGSYPQGTETPGQALYNALRASAYGLYTGRGGSYAFTSATGYDQVIGLPHSFGTPTFKDPNNFTITPVFIGNATITENGTSQSFDFYTVGNAGSSTTYSMS